MNRKQTVIGALVVLVLIAAGVLFFVFREDHTVSDAAAQGFFASTSTSPASALGAQLAPHRQAPAGEKEYYDTQYRFSLLYPQDLDVEKHDEGGGESVITFQDLQSAQGFQIFILPYTENQVTEARFNADEPSGVMRSPSNVTIDGATATSFYSTNAALGDTAEIWFIHGGYLFEVTTLKPLASWLSQIMETWKFI